MLAFIWPHWLDWVSWSWTNSAAYNLWSSTWGEVALKLPLLVLAYRHVNCDVRHCVRLGHKVDGTGHRACSRHHPAMRSGQVTAEHIAEAHRESRER